MSVFRSTDHFGVRVPTPPPGAVRGPHVPSRQPTQHQGPRTDRGRAGRDESPRGAPGWRPPTGCLSTSAKCCAPSPARLSPPCRGRMELRAWPQTPRPRAVLQTPRIVWIVPSELAHGLPVGQICGEPPRRQVGKVVGPQQTQPMQHNRLCQVGHGCPITPHVPKDVTRPRPPCDTQSPRHDRCPIAADGDTQIRMWRRQHPPDCGGSTLAAWAGRSDALAVGSMFQVGSSNTRRCSPSTSSRQTSRCPA